MDPNEPQDGPRSIPEGPKWPPERSLDVHFASVFLMFFESPRFDAEDGGGDGPRPQMERRNVDFQKTSRKRLRNAHPEGPKKLQMNPKMAQNAFRRSFKMIQEGASRKGRGVGGMSEALKSGRPPAACVNGLIDF